MMPCRLQHRGPVQKNSMCALMVKHNLQLPASHALYNASGRLLCTPILDSMQDSVNTHLLPGQNLLCNHTCTAVSSARPPLIV